MLGAEAIRRILICPRNGAVVSMNMLATARASLEASSPTVASYVRCTQPETDVSTQLDLEVLQAQVLGLSKADRARLLERLVVSLDVDVQAEEEWEQLAEAREDEVLGSRVAAVPFEDAMTRLRARFPG